MVVIGVLIGWLVVIQFLRSISRPKLSVSTRRPVSQSITAVPPKPLLVKPSRKDIAVQLDQYLDSVSWSDVVIPSAKYKPRPDLAYFSSNFGATIEPSPAEQLIIDELEKYDILWEREISFPGLRLATGGWSRFDFYLPNHNTVIEYNSKRYHDIPERAEVDKIKEVFCGANNINLVVYTHKDYYHFPARIKELMKELRVRSCDEVLL